MNIFFCKTAAIANTNYLKHSLMAEFETNQEIPKRANKYIKNSCVF